MYSHFNFVETQSDIFDMHAVEIRRLNYNMLSYSKIFTCTSSAVKEIEVKLII